jgi:hypothetical protein
MLKDTRQGQTARRKRAAETLGSVHDYNVLNHKKQIRKRKNLWRGQSKSNLKRVLRICRGLRIGPCTQYKKELRPVGR